VGRKREKRDKKIGQKNRAEIGQKGQISPRNRVCGLARETL
jgi:hypothetical protein